ncbi:unnamed protein product [Polarella glacialis]|uniref:PDZ domain-containing protein n=1 Tax=Polarella glacialis TaxID=89957 RepID=A0A813G3F8_POLGL|nr:unnamed protein product [Polarella glacialis]
MSSLLPAMSFSWPTQRQRRRRPATTRALVVAAAATVSASAWTLAFCSAAAPAPVVHSERLLVRSRPSALEQSDRFAAAARGNLDSSESSERHRTEFLSEPKSRRPALTAALAAFGFSSVVGGSQAAHATLKGQDHDVVVRAADSLHALQERWKSLVAKGSDGAEEVIQEFSGSTTVQGKIVVPKGFSVGVDIEDRSVTGVSERKLGWLVGDVIQSVNGIEIKEESQLISEVKAAKKKDTDIVFVVERRRESPWVYLNRSLEKIYGNAESETELPEPDQVSDMFRDLKAAARLAKDEIVDMAYLKDKVDTFTKAMEAFTVA